MPRLDHELQESPESELHTSDWFRCPRCAERGGGQLQVKLYLAFGNASLSLDCRECGYSHTERDPRSPNWRPWLQRRLYLSAAYLTHPQCSRKLHTTAICPKCTGRNVRVELEAIDVSEPYESSEYETRFGANCESCSTVFETRVRHN